MIKMLKFVVILLWTLSSIEAYNILVIIPTPNVGQWYYMEEFVRALLSSGHTVTSIGCYGARSKHEGHTQIFVRSFDVEDHYPPKNVYGGMYASETQHIWMQWKLGLLNTDYILSTHPVKELIKDKTAKFDLVVADQFNQEAMYLFAHKFNCPLVTIAHFGYTSTMDQSMGLLTPLSFVPHSSLPYSDDMTLSQRFYNTFITAYDVVFRRLNYIRAQNKLAQKHFKAGIEGEIPHVLKMEREISVMLVNSQNSLNKPRPKMPGLIDIGGAHIKTNVHLPVDTVTEFMDSAEHGVIIFSFGTYLRTNEIPNEKLLEIIETFKFIKQRVLLKIENDIDHLPPNVIARRWFAQNELLAHPKVVLFISHGGLLGVQEAIANAVPVIVIPFFNNHVQIGEQVRKNGHGLVLKLDNLTKETFTAAIIEITMYSAFKAKAIEAAKLFNDNPKKPMDTAVYWMEYVIRNHGAKHLKSSSVNYSLSKYLNMDVGIAYFFIFLGTFLFWGFVIKFAIQRYQGREQRGKFKFY